MDDEVEEKAEKKNSPLSKYWCFTHYGDLAPQMPASATYLIYQREVCPDTQRKHWQGYVEFSIKKRRHSVQSELEAPGAHCELRRGTAQQAADYCRKSESAEEGTLKEEGTISKPAANEIAAVKTMIDEGASLSDIMENQFGTFLRYEKSLIKAMQIKRSKTPATFQPIKVIVVWGKPGIGKSRWAYQYAQAHYDGVLYYKMHQKGGASWWDGYDDQKIIIIDDYEGDGPINEILQLTDGYGHNKEWPIKGGFTRINPEVIIFTSNHHPKDWYKNQVDETKIAALLRRMTKIITTTTGSLAQYVKE